MATFECFWIFVAVPRSTTMTTLTEMAVKSPTAMGETMVAVTTRPKLTALEVTTTTTTMKAMPETAVTMTTTTTLMAMAVVRYYHSDSPR